MANDYPKAPYNLFRGVGPKFSEEIIQSGAITKTFDEPTYLTFRLNFDSINTDINNTNFDKFPMPLFKIEKQDNINARNHYSTYQFLRDTDEFVRADMLLDFKEKWNTMQTFNQWYFQRIEGLETILNINPGRGIRVSQEGRIKITMLEALDWRVTHLLNLYRKIAWDDVYQRWILPDMMRNFRMSLYITEFRSFHRSNISSQVGPDSFKQKPMLLQLLENVMPVYVLEFERCEFDIASFEILPGSITVAEAEMREISFDIKVGTFKERYINPIFNFFYHDILVNGFDRSKETKVPAIKLSDANDIKLNEGSYAQGDLLADKDHESGKPFIQSGYVDNIKNATPNYEMDINAVNPIDPATWMGNIFTLGKAFVTNLVESKIDKLKVQKIPGLGISFNEAIAAIQSKNVFTLFGAARRALSESIKDTLPSQELEQNFIDTQFKDFLKGISKSEATDEDALELQRAANIILTDEGKWEEIKDLSKATNLISDALGEINTPVEIENSNALKVLYSSQQYITLPLQDGMVIEGLPSSTATSGKVEGKVMQMPEPGEAVDGDLIEIKESISKPNPSKATNNDLNE